MIGRINPTGNTQRRGAAILKVGRGQFYSIFWVWSSSGGIVKVARASRKVGQEGKTT
jgi:hypothetical protein